ncbi:MAG: 16S rRNA (guanine(527)-N(7))-methyltransferase RsmG [Oscillospiraceae bacterium]|nr:16S rRNA (guanine(527)-N(7))-methyltransferase RsmG [Oscillospiraceae bacterium]
MNEEAARNLFAKYGISLQSEQYRKLVRYAELLKNEGSRQNVTAVDEVEAIWIRHFLDAVYLTKFLPEKSTVIDIGTGGGIPGIPIAILRSDLKITLLDSELRKIEFCRSVCTDLKLNTHTIAGRAEELAHDAAYREQFDCSVSRAMAAGNILSELVLPFVRPGGKMIAMKGRNYTPEQERFESAAKALDAEPPVEMQYDLEGETKYLITVLKLRPTPAEYPRRFAKIKRDPL